ncbi:MAG: IPT/TIG domain-containing protein [Candidatus Nomurabacteria bacterium]|nr:IPT/TIG domain-containing protein [Candidatus Nomurabacteria bacterium]
MNKKLFGYIFFLALLCLNINSAYANVVIKIKNPQSNSVTLNVDSGLFSKSIGLGVRKIGSNLDNIVIGVKTDSSGIAEHTFDSLITGAKYQGYVLDYSNNSSTEIGVIDFTVGDTSTANSDLTQGSSTNTIPKITSVSPIKGKVGDVVTIKGSNFNTLQNVYFPFSKKGEVVSSSDTQIIVKVPSGANDGVITVTTSSDTPAISDINFKITTDASTGNFSKIFDISPKEGKVGDLVTISGEYLTGSTGLNNVFFNTKKAITKTSIPTEITVNVPAGATTGVVSLLMIDGTTALSDTPFKVISASGSGTGTDNNNQNGTSNTGSGSISNSSSSVKWHGLVPECNTGNIVNGVYSNACDFNMVIAIINKVINFLLVTLATPLFALIIIYVGWLYLSDMGSSENIKHAKEILKNAVIGYVIALAAWLIVKTILFSLGFTGPTFLG